MEKRFTLFVTLSALILLGHFWVQSRFLPPPDKKAVAKKGDAKQGDAKQPDAKQPDAKQPDAKQPDGKQGDAKQPDGATKENPEVKPADAPAADRAAEAPEAPETPRRLTDAPARWATLGSADPTSGYRMLVTLNSQGAAVERIEISSDRYRDLEDGRGYLGHLSLALSGKGQGVLVQSVGAGTPAAKAKRSLAEAADVGLKPNDILLEADGTAIARPSDLELVLGKTKPNDPLKLKVLRGAETIEFTTTLDRRPLEVIRPEPDSPNHDPLSFLLTLDSVSSGKKPATIDVGAREIANLASLHQSAWEITQATSDLVEFRFVLDDVALRKIGQSGELELFKRYRIAQASGDKADKTAQGYHLELEVEIKSNAAEPQTVAYRLQGPNGLPLEGWWYSTKISPYWRGGAGARDVVWNSVGEGHRFLGAPTILDNAKKKPESPQSVLFGEGDSVEKRTLQYMAVDTQYFLAALAPETTGKSEQVFHRAAAFAVGDLEKLPKGREKTVNVSFLLQSEPTKIAADKSLKQRFTIFAGPKEPDILAAYGMGDAVELGWWWWVTTPMSWVLHGFYAVVRNHGVAIVMLTLLVRTCMLPISFKMTKNAQKMQALAPELKKLAETYPNDLEKRSRAQQELFAKHGVNMYSGCVLVFFQLPVFAGLYRLLAVDITLRQSPLVPGLDWASNLAGPDKFWRWDQFAPAMLADETGWFGPYLNILPLITVALFMVNQKMLTPPPADEQQEMQQKIMSFMMIFFAAMFFKVPAGLCIYFIASSLWTLAEHKFLRRNGGPLAVATAGAGGTNGGANGGSRGGAPAVSAAEAAKVSEAERRREARKRQKR